MFTLPGSDSHPDANADNYTEEVTMDVNGMALRSVLNGYRTCMSRSQSHSSGITSEHYH